MPGVVPAPPEGAGPLPDRTIEREGDAPRLRAVANPYQTSSGMTVYVTVSDYYLPDPQADQGIVDFLDALLHGAELDGLHLYIVGPPEMPVICGEEAVACYFPGEERIVIVGEAEYAGYPTAYVLAHEYGHHVAAHRRNPPFPGGALNWGTKRWASQVGVCRAVARGTLDPADYLQHPGEGFAEAFAEYHYRGEFPWEFDPFLRPNATSRERLARDVRDPWRANTVARYAGRIGRRQVGRVAIKTPLDGRLIVTLWGPRRANLDLFLRHGRRVVARSTGRGSRERISRRICGERKFDVVVFARRGKGRARVKVSKP